MTKQFNLDKLIEAMDIRMQNLQNQIDRDFGGNMVGRVEALRECKWWKEAILRGEFDD